MSRLALGVLLALLAVVYLPVAMAADEIESIRVNVSRETVSEWQARYLLPQPVAAVQFRRGADLQRQKTWQLLNPELQFDRIDDVVMIRARNRKPFAAFTVRFPLQSFFLNRDYTFHVSNADGSLLLFTGQLYFDLLPEAKPVTEPPFTPHSLLLTPLPNESVLIAGNQRRGQLSWLDTTGQGSYAYFGNGRRQETANGYAIVDGAAPAWARQLVTDLVPPLFARYQARFGFTPAEKPTVTLSYQPDPDNSSFNGSRLADMIQLSIQGDYYAHATEDSVRDLRQLIAHEAAHFWQMDVLAQGSDADHRQAWVHEGGADAAAARVMFELGILSAQQYHRDGLLALNGCIQQVRGIALADAHKKGRGRAYYQCGAALTFILEQQAQARGQQFSVFELWQLMLAKQRQQQRANNSELLQAALADSPVAPALQAALQQFVTQQHADSLTDMENLLTAAGLRFSIDNEQAPTAAHFEQARQWMSVLMAHDCAGAISFYSNQGDNQAASFATVGLAQCQHFQTGQNIHALAGMPLMSAGLDAQLRQQCLSTGTVTAKTDAAELSLACPAQLPAPMQWLVLPLPLEPVTPELAIQQ